MNETRVGQVPVILGADRDDIEIRYYNSAELGRFAVLGVGPIQFHASQSTPEYLRALAAAFTELAAWREQQSVKAVAA